MTRRVFSNPDPENDTLIIQFDDDAMYVIHDGSAEMEPYPEGDIDFDWVELTGPGRARADVLVRSSAVGKQDAQPLNVAITPLGNGRYKVSGEDLATLEVTRHYREEADAYVVKAGLTSLYFLSRQDADAYVARSNPGEAYDLHDGFVVVEWELPNGAFVRDLSDVIDYVRTFNNQSEFFTYHRP